MTQASFADEEYELLTGHSTFVDDIKPVGALNLVVVRSLYPHARINGVRAAQDLAGDSLMLTHDSVREAFGDVSLAADSLYGPGVVRMPVLAADKVNFVGQPIAAVVSAGTYAGEDAAELVEVDYDPLEPVMDPRMAAAGGPLIHEDRHSNVSVRATLGNGDVDAAFASADRVVEDELYVHRVAANPIEPRGVVASYDGNRFNVWASCQGVYALRNSLSQALGIPPEKFHVVQPSVGGAFGSKSPAYPEYVLCCLAAKKTGRPVKWIESRGENLVATHQGRDAWARLSLAARKDGRVVAVRGSVLADIGAYNFSINANYAGFVAQLVTGPYAIGAARVDAVSVFTNKTPTGPYRGAGRPEGAFFIERMLDLLAADLGMDPAEVRAVNLIPAASMPYLTPFGLTIDPSDYPGIFSSALSTLGYDTWRRWASERKREGRLAGVGLADYAELNRASIGESADLRISADGQVVLSIGSGPHGQGLRAIAAQLAAEELGLAEEEIAVRSGDSDYAPSGVGTFGSRGAAVGGGAVVEVCRDVVATAMKEASRVLSAPPAELSYGGFSVRRGRGGDGISMRELARTMGGMHSFRFYSAKDVYAFGVHLAVVEVDGETGTTKVVHYGAVDDVGRAINRDSVEGQVFGGVLQGVGQVLYEGIAFNSDGQPLVTSISDAGVPTSAESVVVSSSLVEIPSSLPHHARGVGEAGTIGALSATVRAVEDAIGVRLRTTDLKPATIWRLRK